MGRREIELKFQLEHLLSSLTEYDPNVAPTSMKILILVLHRIRHNTCPILFRHFQDEFFVYVEIIFSFGLSFETFPLNLRIFLGVSSSTYINLHKFTH